MRNLKKVLTLVLTVAMLLSVMVVGTGAAFSDQDSIKNKEAVDVCTTLNIIAGMEDGSYRPANNVTRAQMCKMICVALNGGKEPTLGTNATPTFSDVRTDPSSSWAESFIESCNSQGIVSGVGGGRFSPSGSVTGTQAARMLLVALGYRADLQGFTGDSWAINVNTIASAKGLYAGIESIDANAALSRDNAAQMIWNALNAYEVEYVSQLTTVNGTLTSELVAQDKVVGSNKDKITLLKDKYEVYDDESAVMTGFSYESSKNEWTYTFDNNYVTANSGNLTVKGLTVTCSEDYTDLFLQNVKVLYTQKGNLDDDSPNKVVDKVYGMYADGSSVMASGVLDDIELVTGDTSKVKIDGTEYKLTKTTADVKLANFNDFDAATNVLTGIEALKDTNAAAYSFELIDNTDDNRGDVIVVHPFVISQIDYLSSTKATLTNGGGGSQNLSDINLYSGAAEDDWTIVTAAVNAKDETLTVEKANIISGTVGAIRTNSGGDVTSVRVDGTWYTMATTLAPDSDTINANSSYDLVVQNGFVFHAEKTKGNVSAENVLFLDKLGALSSGLADGVEAKVYFADGTSKIITINTLAAPAGEEDLTAGDDYDIVKENPASDEITNDAAATILDKYNLYTYSEKSGEYTVEPITANNVGGYDQFVNEGNKVKDGKVTNSSATVSRFDDDAVIFVNDKDGVKVVTGKTVNNWKETTITGFVGLGDKSNGNLYTVIGAITMSGTAKSDASAYGFITSSIAQEKIDGTWYYTFQIWNGEETVDLKVEKAGAPALAKYDFIQFNWEDQENNEATDCEKKSAADADAITAFVADKSVTFAGGEYDFADTFFIIGVDTDKGEGASTRSLATAKDCQVEGHNGKYANAVYFTVQDGSDTVVEAVFIDVNGIMEDSDGNEQCTCTP